MSKPMLRIHDILVWIRIRAPDPGSVLLIRDPDPDADPSIFITDLQDANKKLIKKVYLYTTFQGTFTLFFKDKMSKEATKQ
jgi:hypothetical protein